MSRPQKINPKLCSPRPKRNYLFQLLLKGRRTFFMSCQFGVIFTAPAVPHCLHTNLSAGSLTQLI